MNSCMKRYISIFMCFIVFISFSGCGAETVEKEKRSSKPKSNKTEKKREDSDFERIVICGHELHKDDYYVKRRNGTDYLMVKAEAFKFSFKIPYLYSTYPDVEQHNNGLISILWKDRDEIFLKADLEEGSTTAVINGREYDMGMAPVLRNETLYIPSNFFISLLEMEEKYDRKLDTKFIDRIEDFPGDILLGRWSDIDTNLFVGYKDYITGLVDLPSFAQAFSFNKDGSYSIIMVSTGGYKDTFLYLEGKYVIHGNTIACYDIHETLYEGGPLQLIHKNKRLENMHYEYINNYKPGPDEEQIELTFWLSKAE